MALPPYPEEYGGSGGDCVGMMVGVEEIARGDVTLGGLLNIVSIVNEELYVFGTEEQKQNFVEVALSHEAKGTTYPKLASLLPNQTHQADLVGPCYLKGPVRFYSLNVVDTATVRCGMNQSPSKAGQSIIDGFWAIWTRMGMPNQIQIDNAMSFFGSPTHPRGMGPSSDCVCTTTSSHGSSQWPNLGETE